MGSLDLQKIIEGLKYKTENGLDCDLFRDIIVLSQRSKADSQPEYIAALSLVCPVLLKLLEDDFVSFDTQLICANACYNSVVSLCSLRNKLLIDTKQYLVVYRNYQSDSATPIKERDTKFVLSIIYGTLHSNILDPAVKDDENSIILDIMSESLNILSVICYQYTYYTYMSFKLLQSLLQKCLNTCLLHTKSIFNKNSLGSLLLLTVHNWENPITGIRDLNYNVFSHCLDAIHLQPAEYESLYESLLMQIHNIPWNKAKYYMLFAIITKENRYFHNINKPEYNWVNGTIDSLNIPNLVSIGTKMYLSIVNKLRTETEWCELFHERINIIIQSGNMLDLKNLHNYWLLGTIKRFPALAAILLTSLKDQEVTDGSLFMILAVLRCSLKLGIIDNCWSKCESSTQNAFIADKIKIGLDHSNIEIRILSFDIVCFAHKNNLPSKEEFEFFLNFIKQNINTDSTPLRQKMLDSSIVFLIRVQNSTMPYLKRLKHSKNNDLEALCSFMKSLRVFLLFSLQMKGNYQRKITSLKILELILRYFDGEPSKVKNKKNALYRKNTNSPCVRLLKEYCIANDCWILSDSKLVTTLTDHLNDPSDDVREASFELLLEYFETSKGFQTSMELILQKSLVNVNSKLFYEIDSGLSMIKTIICMLNKTDKEVNNQLTYHSFPSLYTYVSQEILRQFNSQKKDILFAIYNNEPVNGVVSVLNILLSTGIEQSLNLDAIMANTPIKQLIDLLCEIVIYFVNTLSIKREAGSIEANYPPSFSEMGESIECIVHNSSYRPQGSKNDKGDQEKLSDSHQLVLNCIWLNLKACCELAHTLITSFSTDEDEANCLSCFEIYLSVLKLCRHKGAIEAAGLSLGQSVRYLTKFPSTRALNKVPGNMLKQFLNEVLDSSQTGGSISRRSAGLSILVHKIVANDVQVDKPLFEYTMTKLLEACKTEYSDSNDIKDLANFNDVHRATLIHLMCRIVEDSYMASDVIYYASELADICFNNLRSEQWQIRNAALQLYGALVPKLIGQKKAQGPDVESSATVNSDELFTHIPSLWKYIENQLTHVCPSSVLEHSNLVPILNLLSSMAQHYTFHYNITHYNGKPNYKNIFKGLITLLRSPIYTVRRLAAKTIELVYEFESFYKYIQSIDLRHISENCMHGHGLVLRFYKHRNKLYLSESILKCIDQHCNALQCRNSSFLVRAVFEEMKQQVEYKNDKYVETINTTFSESHCNKSQIGFGLWLNSNLKSCIVNCHLEDLPIVIKTCIKEMDIRTYLTYIQERLNSEKNIPLSIVALINKTFIEFDNKYNHSLIWEIMYDINKNITLKPRNDTTQYSKLLVSHLVDRQYQYDESDGYLLPLIIKFVTDSSKEDDFLLSNILSISYLIKSLCSPQSNDIPLRQVAAVSVNAFHPLMLSSPIDAKVKSNILITMLYLLQDEVTEVRDTITEHNLLFLNISPGLHVHAYVFIRNILNYDNLSIIFNNNLQDIKNFVQQFRNEIVSNDLKVAEKASDNPFESNGNIYWESGLYLSLLEELCQERCL